MNARIPMQPEVCHQADTPRRLLLTVTGNIANDELIDSFAPSFGLIERELAVCRS